MTADYLELRLGDFLRGLAGGTPAPGGASAAALTAAFAACLVGMAARHSRGSWGDAAGVAAQAQALEARTAPLAQRTGEAWEEALEALRQTGSSVDGALEEKLARAAEVPLEIAEAAADVAVLGALTAELGDGTFRSDVAAAAVLAAAASRAGAHFVDVNLATRPDDVWLLRARRAADVAEEAAARALDAGP